MWRAAQHHAQGTPRTGRRQKSIMMATCSLEVLSVFALHAASLATSSMERQTVSLSALVLHATAASCWHTSSQG